MTKGSHPTLEGKRIRMFGSSWTLNSYRTVSVWFLMGLLFLEPLKSQAQISLVLQDGLDDWQLAVKVSKNPDVAKLAQELDRFERKLKPLKERDFVRLFGKKAARTPKLFAMSCAQSHCVSLPGIRFVDEKLNKDHVDFYAVDDCGGMEVYFGVTAEVVCIVPFLKVDKQFPTLNEKNLETRLSWDREHFRKLVQRIEKRWPEVFEWEIDPEAEKKLTEGDFSHDGQEKLAAWIASGEKLGYRLVKESTSIETDHKWYRKDGTLAREAFSYPDGPYSFIWYHVDGDSELRSEGTGKHRISSWRWCRKRPVLNIRSESSTGLSGPLRPDHWVWCNALGKVVREEWNDNGQGIPNRVSSGTPPFNRMPEDAKPLKMDDSWAVHPELIPEESRISDQPNRRVPIRKILKKNLLL